ncbi:ImmA/IrrE family metallo-endopeptidase [Bradyrhizobium sp. AUGA SZCCT0176]|uniref:ImmA/IrrE family metallo-endopeptidase n=1 Tax=Bradyrhizobium sp. AUGA SZCCT0176 TaxID=2807664 RepID=UPI001BA8CF08|nr:ImmA/IrrE family metallo-endopeptidase [Bradyrhizobium sp. AUGA SZCCT0176]MBR1225237.1 ImmA/IrrE family metallo-endopeptidase [Bradyrhizobium sp. AUGA SZCCT0176]
MTRKPGPARRSLAEAAASSVLRQMKIDGLWVDPEAIAACKGIAVKAKPDTAAGVSGMLIKVGDNFGIMYATHVPSRGFQRFSISHELGHYFIEGHPEAILTTGVHQSHAGFVSGDPFEQEADYFAAALLMPELPFKKAIADHDPGLACVESLRKACETSLTATAIRYSSLTSDGIAVLSSCGDTIDWCFMSDGLKQAKGLSWVRKGTPVPAATVTARFNAEPGNVTTGQREAGEGRLNDWVGGDRPYRVTEEVVGLGRYGRTLTILTCKNLSLRAEAEEPENDEEALIESWTPRFRR